MNSKPTSKFLGRIARLGAAAAVVATGVAATAGSASAFVNCGCTSTQQAKPLVFASNRDGVHTQIFSQNSDGSGLKELTTDSAMHNQPSYDSSRAHVAYTSNFSQYVPVIWFMNADGTSQRRLTAAGTNWTETDPSLNAAGNKIAFTSNRTGSQQIFVMNTDGTGVTQLTPNYDGAHSHPAFSPDGQRIAFIRNYNGLSDVYMMNANGTGMTRVTFDGVINTSGGITWSPDGQKIAYTSNISGDPEVFWSWAFDVQASNRVSNRAGFDGQPTWSPDGSAIVFTQYVGSTHRLVQTDTAGNNLRVVASTGTVNESANWGYASAPPMNRA